MSGPRLSVIPARAATDPALKPRDLQVLCVLGRHTDDLGWCRRSQVKMANEMNCARSTVFEAIERLVSQGYLERHEQPSENGRDSAHVYRVILDPIHPDLSRVRGEELDASDPCRYSGTPAGIAAPPAGPRSAPPAGSGPAPINDPSLTTPLNSERERGREDGEEETTGLPGEATGRGSGERIFRRAFAAWPSYATDSEQEARRAWNSLAPADRQAAVDALEPYKVKLKDNGRKIACTFGKYLREKRWERLGRLGGGSSPTAVSEMIEAKAFGATWNAICIRSLLTEAPVEPPPPANQFLRDLHASDPRQRAIYRAEHGWPKVRDAYRGAVNWKGLTVPGTEQDLQALMAPVTIGSPGWNAWQAEYEARGWPFVPTPKHLPVVWFPKGGPAGLEAFEAALKRNEGQGDDGDQSQAAE